MDRLLTACLATATLGLLLLAVAAHRAEPTLLSLDEAARYEGQAVCVEGTLLQLHANDWGTTRLVLADGNHSLEAYAPFPVQVDPGTPARACGTLQRGPHGFRVLLRAPADLEIQSERPANRVPLAELASEPWHYRDQRVETQGRIVVDAGRTYLEQTGLDARLRLRIPENARDAQGVVTAKGLLRFDPAESLFLLQMEALEPEA